MTTLAGQVVLVTGSGRGLGAQIASAAVDLGATVVVADVRAEAAHESAASVAARARASAGSAVGMPLDVGDDSGVRDAIARIVDRHGRLDAVVNNAAVDVTEPVSELGVQDWDRIVRTNLTGPFLIVKHALAALRSTRGQIVNIASTAPKRAWPNASAYHATKWGLLGLSHALHAELRPHGVKVTAIVSGGMRTPFLTDRFPDLDTGLLMDPANVARAVMFALTQPPDVVVPELMVLPMRETSWP